MPINLDYIFQRDLANEWVSQRTPLLNQDFLSGAVADMDNNADVATPNEGDMAVDMDTDYNDYAEDEYEVQDDEEIDGTMENDWQGPIVQECEGAQHDAVPDDQEDPMRLAREEVQASRSSSYSTKERRSRSQHRNLREDKKNRSFTK
ncbi:hypothetical protein AMTR_s00010p00024500 [Amborella trichopoda]|uniref:Uncharacterized protein n=1 Tax=Amborella trichopoda TaxID=13333 RepID=W1NF15_AMBTC|nr:hypothetical protein AMTR_s00010p00024500 [Amborella trichopoda]